MSYTEETRDLLQKADRLSSEANRLSMTLGGKTWAECKDDVETIQRYFDAALRMKEKASALKKKNEKPS